MKTKANKKSESGLPSRPDEQRSENNSTSTQQSKPTRTLPYVNHAERQKSRSLPSAEVLAHLRRWYPEVYGLAEVVGQWVWVTFTEQPAEHVRAGLSQIGFHWNNHRKCWQHPCGQFATEGSGQDPRQKYGSILASAARTAADLKAA